MTNVTRMTVNFGGSAGIVFVDGEIVEMVGGIECVDDKGKEISRDQSSEISRVLGGVLTQSHLDSLLKPREDDTVLLDDQQHSDLDDALSEFMEAVLDCYGESEDGQIKRDENDYEKNQKVILDWLEGMNSSVHVLVPEDVMSAARGVLK